MIRKYTPIEYGWNLTGVKGISLSHDMEWNWIVYIGWRRGIRGGGVYFGVNLHPNRLHQILFGPRYQPTETLSSRECLADWHSATDDGLPK